MADLDGYFNQACKRYPYPKPSPFEALNFSEVDELSEVDERDWRRTVAEVNTWTPNDKRIKKAYLKQTLKVHPDKAPNAPPGAFVNLKSLYHLITDPSYKTTFEAALGCHLRNLLSDNDKITLRDRLVNQPSEEWYKTTKEMAWAAPATGAAPGRYLYSSSMITLLGTFLLIDRLFGPKRRRSFPMRIINGFKIGAPIPEILFLTETVLASLVGPGVRSGGIMWAAIAAFTIVRRAVEKGIVGGEAMVLEALSLATESKAIRSLGLMVPTAERLRALYRQIRQRAVDASLTQIAAATITLVLLGHGAKRLRRRVSRR